MIMKFMNNNEMQLKSFISQCRPKDFLVKQNKFYEN